MTDSVSKIWLPSEKVPRRSIAGIHSLRGSEWKRHFQIRLDGEVLKFYFLHSHNIRPPKRHRILLRFSWNFQGPHRSLSLETNSSPMLCCISQMTKLLMMTRGMNVGYETSQAFVTSSSPFCNSTCKYVDGRRNVKSTNSGRHVLDSYSATASHSPFLKRWSSLETLYNCCSFNFLLTISSTLSSHLLCHKTKLLYLLQHSRSQWRWGQHPKCTSSRNDVRSPRSATFFPARWCMSTCIDENNPCFGVSKEDIHRSEVFASLSQ